MTAWIFDIDGVLTNLTAEKILLPQIPIIIQEKLKNDEPVAFITGRSLEWLEETTLSKINPTENDAKNLFIACEFGSVIATYVNNQLLPNVNSIHIVPLDLRQKAENIIKKYSDSIELEDKQTLFTSKIKEEVSIEQFKEAQQKAMLELKQLLEEMHSSDFEVQADSIGLSIRHKSTNKRESVKKLLNWLSERKINPDKFTVFGDSDSDLEMGEELKDKGLNFEFVYVGDGLKTKPNFPITTTNKKHDEGTLEFLTNN